LLDGAARQRLSRLRRMPREHRRTAKRVSEAAVLRHGNIQLIQSADGSRSGGRGSHGYGSDYPHLLGSIERSVSSIEDLPIPDHEKQKIFSGTAMTILNNV